MTIEELAAKLQKIGHRAMQEMGRLANEAGENPLRIVELQHNATAATVAVAAKKSKSEFLEACGSSYDVATRIAMGRAAPTGKASYPPKTS